MGEDYTHMYIRTHIQTYIDTHSHCKHTHTHSSPTRTFWVLNSSMASPTRAPTHFGSSSSARSKASRALLSLPSLRKQRPSPRRTFPEQCECKWECNWDYKLQ